MAMSRNTEKNYFTHPQIPPIPIFVIFSCIIRFLSFTVYQVKITFEKKLCYIWLLFDLYKYLDKQKTKST